MALKLSQKTFTHTQEPSHISPLKSTQRLALRFLPYLQKLADFSKTLTSQNICILKDITVLYNSVIIFLFRFKVKARLKTQTGIFLSSNSVLPELNFTDLRTLMPTFALFLPPLCMQVCVCELNARKRKSRNMDLLA